MRLITCIVSAGQNSTKRALCLASIKIQKIDCEVEIVEVDYGQFPQRIHFLRQAKGSYVLFLDEDCLLPRNTYLKELFDLMDLHAHVEIAGGRYLDAVSSGYFDRAYNFLCLLWILPHRPATSRSPQEVPNLLGGCLVLRNRKIWPENLRDPQFWGGEDTFVIRLLQKAGFKCFFDDRLSLTHADGGSLFKWIKRAYLHGFNGQRYNLLGKNIKIDPKNWRKVLLFALPLFLHQVFLVGGKLMGALTAKKVLETSSLTNSKA